MAADEALAGEDADAFEAVHVVVVPGAQAGVLVDAEVVGQPGEAAEQGAGLAVLAAADDAAVGAAAVTFAGAERVAGDVEAGDASGGHAAAGTAAGLVAPGAVDELGLDPGPFGVAPHVLGNGNAGLARLVEAEEGELGVGEVGVGEEVGSVAPHAVGVLDADEPFGGHSDVVAEADRVGDGEDLDFEGRGVDVHIGVGADGLDGLPHGGVVGGDAGVEQGEGGKGGGAAGLMPFAPLAVGALVSSEPGGGFLDGFADFLAGDLLGGGGFGQERGEGE